MSCPEINGYGDQECEDCEVWRTDEDSLRAVCLFMVECTRLQIEEAKKGNWRGAIELEHKQNGYALRLGCVPGLRRV